ncbi:fructose-6-phosphate aldolase [Maritimibacter sp. UBA3975]|uniref:fructose-6-phosphate aldolase n=1 Tax=Maritimibacter sp. UBA3975 TaxID=1946833 RepID=UPI000C0A21E8|nr:fructose-6-phosphate aldolase [Maritimibacter sp. UBA3975]MAM60099.1 fructose-6-phosphate aldolase [Maritimibacter sp.]|tara:strand:- start:2411 stop:3067 length:657 start_codon:yes stop_codon:yes gene_type:complete
MKIFVDSADTAAIRRLAEAGLIDGVTTNPSLIAKAGADFLETVGELAAMVQGPVSAEVAATDYDGMMREAAVLAKIAPNVCIKLPLTMEGLRACRALRAEGRETNVTLCFTANQALLAAKADATYISPFVGRLDDINLDGGDLLRDIREIYDNYPALKTQILAASLRSANHVTDAARAGADAATMPPAVIESLVHHPLTEKGLSAFLDDWRRTGQRIA